MNKVIYRAVSLSKLIEVFLCEQRLVADFKAYHRNGPAGLKNDLRGFRIVINVGFGGGIHVAATDRTSH